MADALVDTNARRKRDPFLDEFPFALRCGLKWWFQYACTYFLLVYSITLLCDELVAELTELEDLDVWLRLITYQYDLFRRARDSK